ncbi:hypothetical protein [Nocardioides sp.]|uniref:hypothetical protein n=1 Tax=Nocardioides sp. TaxID=35761 RepID=UPI003511F11A
MSAHVARPRRPRVRPVLMVVAALGLTSLPGPPAQAAAERVLQNVDVRLDTAGAVTGISSVVLRAAADSTDDPDSDEVAFDPSEYADRLPVRVLTSYRTEDGRVGTDLADLEGEDGLVVIDVTVQNTTATTRWVRAETAARQVEAPALVGAPLTVVGGVTLDGDDLARVVTTAPGGAEGDADAAVTNGVVSRAGEDTRVQWSTFLAPPRLAGTATFRLAVQAEDFEPPTIDLSVQPGLVTDPSVLGLLDTVFGDGPGSVAQLDTDTLALVGQIDATLAEAATNLTDVQRALATAGDDLGTRTIDSLVSGQDLLRTELGGLITDLSDVRDGATSELDATGTAVTGQVDDSLDRVLAFLGDPDTLLAQWRARRSAERIDRRAPRADDGCEVAVPTIDPRAPIYAQMLAIADGLQAVRDGAGACRDRIQEVISTGLTRAQERIGDAQDLLGRTLDDVQGLSTPLADAVRTRLAGGLESSLDQLVARGDEIARATDVLTRRLPRTSKADLDDAVGELGDLLGDLQSLLDLTGSGSDLDSGLAGVRADAVAGAQALVGPGSVQADLAAAAEALCALPLDPAVASAATDRDAVVARLIGEDCAGTAVSGGPAPVSAGITAASELLTGIADRIDDPQPAPDPLRIIRKALQGAFTVASGVRTRLDSTKGRLDTALSGLGDELDTLRDAVDAVAVVDDPTGTPLTATVVDGECVLSGGGSGTAAIDVLERDARLLLCRQQLIDATLEDGLTASTTELRAATAQLDQPRDALGALDTELDGRTRAVFADLFGSLERTRREVLVCRLGAQIERQRDALGDPADTTGAGAVQRQCPRVVTEADGTSVRQGATAGIDDAVASSISLIDTRISASTGDIADTQARLVTSLSGVLRAIGDPQGGGTGLLDTVADQVDSTGVAAADLADAGARAGRFGSVREQSLLGLAQQREADRLSRELVDELGLFGITAPAGSTTRVVYTFSLGPDGDR